MKKIIQNLFQTHPVGKLFSLGQKKVVWKKVADITPGTHIAVEENKKLEWDEVVSIKKVGYERVYDVEVEGTHTFVGNGIVAHNTYVSGNVGIGVTNPTTRLAIGGSTSTISNVSGDITITPASDLIISQGNVGIRTTTPGALLDIGLAGSTLGTLRLEGNTSGYVQIQPAAAAGSWTLTLPGDDGTSSGLVLSTNGSGVTSWTDVNTLVTGTSQYWQQTLGSLAPTNITDALNLGNTATGSALVHFPGTNNADAWFNLGTGNVGIGNNAPTAGYKLHVTGDILANGLIDTSSPGTWFVNPAGASNINSLTAFGNITAANASVSGTLTVGEDQSIGAAVGKLKFVYNSSGTPLTGMTLTNTGRVGIGTENPDYALDVVGNIKLSSGLIAGSNGAGISGYVLTSSGGGVNTWTDVVGLVGGSNQWQRTLGSLAPNNITDDLNLGAIATGSAIVHLPGLTNKDAFFNLGTGKLGVGLTNPAAKLDILGNLNVSTYATVGASLAVGYSSAPAGPGHGIFAGNVGIGTSTPTSGYRLDVNGSMTATNYYDRDDLTNTYFLNPAGAGTSLKMAGDFIMEGNTIDINGTGTTTINSYDTTNTVWTTIVLKGSNDTTSVSVCIEGTGTCNGKLDVGTVDPPYTINGKKYATYLPSMTGVKEETTGQVKLTTKSKSVAGYEYVIDFDQQEDGSDLWLFAKTTNLKQRLHQLTVLLSPNENARTWYKIDEARRRLTLYSSRPTTLSYRLTAPRFDAENWKNVTPNGSGGFVITDPDDPVTPDISIDGNGNLTGQLVASSGSEGGYQVLDELGTVVEETVLQAKTISAQVIAGLVSAQKIVSPLAEIDSLQVNEIKPTGQNLTIALQPTTYPLQPNAGSLSKLIITGLNNTPVATIDALGNASFAGTLTAQTVESQKSKVESLEASNASVSGTLIVKNIQSETIDNLSSQIASSTSTLSTNYQLLSSNINAVQSELAAIKSQPLPNPAYYQKIDASYSNLTVNDTANIYKAHIADSLVVGTLFIQPSSILALSDDLRISALSTIRLFDDAVVIAKNGDLTMKGEISASSLAIKNTDGQVVASIDASGSARFNEVVANKFSLEQIATQGAFIADSGIRNEQNIPIPAIKTSTEVAGVGTLPQDVKEVIIYNENVTDNSLIYLTPTTDNIQGQLSVSKKVSCTPEQTCSPYFVVSSNNSIHSPTSFNWLIIN